MYLKFFVNFTGVSVDMCEVKWSKISVEVFIKKFFVD